MVDVDGACCASYINSFIKSGPRQSARSSISWPICESVMTSSLSAITRVCYQKKRVLAKIIDVVLNRQQSSRTTRNNAAQTFNYLSIRCEQRRCRTPNDTVALIPLVLYWQLTSAERCVSRISRAKASLAAAALAAASVSIWHVLSTSCH